MTLLVFILSSCQILKVASPNKGYIENSINFLCSDKCEGRLPGTNGNKEAEKYIENCFKDIGLDMYNGSYLHPYQHRLLRAENKDYNIVLNFKDGKTYVCEEGEDFYLNYLMNADIKAPITTNINDRNIENSIVAISESDKISGLADKAKVVLVVTPKFSFNIAAKMEGNIPIIQISQQLYDLLKENEGTEAEIKFDVQATEEEISQNNVIGVIPGENHNNVIVVTAHFDHVGRVGKTICRGCIDNATGTAAIIDIADRLIKNSKKHKLEQDIIFCAFNGEEPYLQGSEAFVNSIMGKYESIYCINIDCVGYKKGKKLMVFGDDEGHNISEDLSDRVKEYFDKNEIDTVIVKNQRADHLSFSGKDIPAITLIQEGWHNVGHTVDDDIDKADFKYISKVGELVSNFIMLNPSKKFTAKNTLKNPPTDELLNTINIEREKLEFNQYKYIMIGNEEKLVENNSSQFGDHYKEQKKDDLVTLKSLYPGLYIAKNIGDYELNNVGIYDNSKEYIKNPEIDKVYCKKYIAENIRCLEFNYTKGKYKTNEYNEIYLTLTRERKNDEIYNKDYTFKAELEQSYEYSIDEKETKIGNELYYIMYGKNDNTIKGLYKCIKYKNETFHIVINSINSEWGYKTVDETIKVYNNLKLKDIIDKNVKYLELK